MAETTPTPNPDDIKDTIDRIRSGFYSSISGGDSGRYGTMPFAPSPGVSDYTPPTQAEKAPPVLQGGINLVGGILRGVFALGRGSTNLANDVLPYANKIFDITQDGVQANEVGDLFGNYVQMGFAGQRGLAKGILYSFMSPTQETRDALQGFFGGEKPVEAGYELFQTKGFREAAQNIPALQQVYSEEKVGEIGVPFTDWKFDVTPAGLYGFGWDVLTDPFSFATMGLGGAVKGAVRGVSAATKAAPIKAAAKAGGKTADVADLPASAIPRPFYTYTGAGKEARKIERLAPANVKYNVLNTSVPGYILREMGRGFIESHKRALLASTSRRAAKSAKKEMTLSLGRQIAEHTTKNGAPPTEAQILAEFIPAAQTEVFERATAKLKNVGAKNESNLQTLLARVEGQMAEAVKSVLKEDVPLLVDTLVTNAARVAERAVADDIPYVEAAQYELADRFAREAEAVQPAITRTKAGKYQSNELTGLAAGIRQAADAKAGKGNFTETWNGFIKNADAETKRGALEALISPLGYRTAARRRGVEETKEVAQKAGKKTRTTAKLRVTEEFKEMKKRLRMAIETAEGGKSEGVAKLGRKTRVPSDAEIIDAPVNILGGLAKEFNTLPTEEFKKALLDNPDQVTGEMLDRVLSEPRLAAERIAYLMERDAATPTKEFLQVQHLRYQNYNPLKPQLETPKLRDFATTREEVRAAAGTGDRARTTFLNEATTLAVKASGKYIPEELRGILTKLGVKQTVIASADSPKAVEEVMHAAYVRKYSAKVEAEFKKLLTKKYGTVEAARFLGTEVPLPKEIQVLLVEAEQLASRAFSLTDDELKRGIELAAEMKDEQFAAILKLDQLGFNVNTQAGRVLIETLSAKEMGAIAAKRATQKESVAVTGELKQLEEFKKRLAAPPIEGSAPLRPIFEKVFASLKEQVEKPGTEPSIRELFNELGKVVKEAIAASPTGSQQRVRAIFSQLGNVVKRYEDTMQRGTVAGFDFVFTKRAGEYDTAGMASLMARSYAASRSAGSIDNGVFADYIDSLLRGKKKEPLSTVKTHRDRIKHLRSITSQYGGEGLNPSVLVTTLRVAENVGTRGGEKLSTNKSFVEDVNRLTGEFYKQMENDLIESAQLTPASGSVGWIDRLPAESEKLAARGAISEFETELPEQLITNANKKLAEIKKAQPDNYALIATAIGAPKFSRKVSYKQIARLQELSTKSGVPLDGQLTRVVDAIVKTANEAAVKTVTRQRANVLIKELAPEMISKQAILKMADKVGRKENAYDSLRARFLLSTMIVKADVQSRLADNAVSVLPKLQFEKSLGGLAKEQASFKALLTNLENKFKKMGHAAPREGFADLSLDEVLAMDDPLAFIGKVREMAPGSDKRDTDEWGLAMQHLLNLTTVGKTGVYKTYKQLIDSYRNAQDLMPGDINPVTGKPVPSEAQVLQTLKLLGEKTDTAERTLKKNGKLERKTILKMLDNAEERITAEEMKRIGAYDFIEASNVVGKETVREMTTELPPAQVTKEQAVETLLMLERDLDGQGLGWLSTVALYGVGGSVKQFFVDRFRDLQYTLKTKAGRIVDADSPDLESASRVLKRTFEPYTNYTGTKKVMQTLADMAEQRFPNWKTDQADLAGRAAWLDKHYMLAVRYRDAYLLARGIVPQKTIALSTGEAIPNKIQKLLKEDRETPADSVSAYLSDGDILDILPPEVRQSMFFSGREVAMPFTSLLPAARLLVIAIDDLPAGAWFNKEQLQALASGMAELTVRDVWSTSVSQYSKVSLASLNEEAVSEMISVLVRYMLQPENAMKLYDQHLMNASIAIKLLKYEADSIAEPIMSAWRRVVESPIASSGDKMQATIDAFEELRRVLGQDSLGEEDVRFMAYLDSQVALASEIDLDSFITLQEGYQIARGGVPSADAKARQAEMRKIAKLQKAGRPADKESVDSAGKAIYATMEARTKMLDSIYEAQLLRQIENGQKLDVDTQYDVFNEVYTNVAFYNHALAYADKWAERVFYDYKMENLRAIYGGLERETLEDTEEFTNIVSRVARKWQKIESETGVNYPAAAFKVLQEIPREQRPQLMLNADIIVNAARKVDTEAQEAFAAGGVKQMMDYAEELKPFFPEDEPLLLQAAVELWSAGGHLIGGGSMSKIARSGLPPKWINMQIRMFGSAEAKELISETGGINEGVVRIKDGFGFNPSSEKLEDMSWAWEEWDIQNPFQMFVGLNNALSKASKVPMAAREIELTHGVKFADFRKEGETLGEAMTRAKSEGLVRIRRQEKLTPGKELIHFLNTEDFLFPEAIAQELGEFSQFLTAPSRDWERFQKLLTNSKWQTVQNMAKQMMTILRPGNWLMNFMGGVWTNFMFGVNSPVAYMRAYRMFQQGAIDIKKIGLDPKALEGQMVDYFAKRSADGLIVNEANNPLTSGSMLVSINGKARNVDYKDLWEVYKKIGARVPTAQSKEYDLLGEFGSLEAFNKQLSARNLGRIYNKGLYRLGRLAAIRDDYLRATLWLDEISKNNWPSLEAAAKSAMKKIDRAHPQMQDLSKFNSSVMRQLMLFFTWRAKTFGWIMYDILDKPSRIIIPLKAQYNFEAMQGDKPEYFGSFDLPDMPIRSFQQGNLDFTTPGNAYTFSLANPVTDLLGSQGWLSGISFNTYDSAGTMALTSGQKTLENFLYSSTPLIATAILDWGNGRLSNKRDLTTNGISATQDIPYFVEDAMGQLGWGPAHILLAMVAPDYFKRASWAEAGVDEAKRDAARTVTSWALGIRPRELDSVQNREKALQEIFSKIAELQREEIGY